MQSSSAGSTYLTGTSTNGLSVYRPCSMSLSQESVLYLVKPSVDRRWVTGCTPVLSATTSSP
ncbi:hypothetical protein F7734_16335 [Scytonema sp. UIC 10036]|uniref:hypothetical protein n=1 Tax=Scytonema sp. UIC 10036 TaxID=2304196 RepID=UPI0012DA7683|nr:hypothetical protein [Scytonema sp. UIC 10036]MUG93888.1 hypothetical protein [Scytonema sp. UIC 10036]